MDWYQYIMKHHIVISIIIWKSYHIIDLVLLLSNDIIDLLWEASSHFSMIFNYLENHGDHSFHPYDSLYINYHMYISINRFLFVFHPLIWIVTMIIRYDMICDCIIINYQILSPLLISIILLFSLFITMCIGFISTPHYLTKLIFIIIVVQNGNIVSIFKITLSIF